MEQELKYSKTDNSNANSQVAEGSHCSSACEEKQKEISVHSPFNYFKQPQKVFLTANLSTEILFNKVSFCSTFLLKPS